MAADKNCEGGQEQPLTVTEGEDGWGMGDDGDEERGRPGWLPPFLLWGVDGFLVGGDVDLVGLDGGLGTAVEVVAELD